MNGTPRPVSILIAALGGEGGGVLADWLVDSARGAGLAVQATSVPGVAQRTGATSYYLEFLPQPIADDASPVFALMPVPGRVDVVVASELLEAGRMIERGFVAPDRTLLIAASHRVYTTLEKIEPGDGRIDDEAIHDTARQLSRRYLSLDLQAIAATHHTVISATLFGALAGSGALPWSRDRCEAAIRAGGLGVPASLAGFADAFERAALAVAPDTAVAAPPPELASILALGHARLADYQDVAYADLYRTRIDALVGSGPATAGHVEAARQLALWMGYEDVIRVADLKTRRDRLARVRAEAQAGPDDIVVIRDHLRPGLEEIAAIAPAPIGRLLHRWVPAKRPIGTRGRGFALATTSITGFAALRLLASMRRWRRSSLRFAEEQQAIERWLAALARLLPADRGFGAALAELPRLRKGYSDTAIRGIGHYERIFAMWVDPMLSRLEPPTDEDTRRLRAAIDEALGTPPSAADPIVAPAAREATARPIRWHARDIERPRGASR